MKSLVYKIKIFSLCLFAFSLGIEYWDPLGIRHILTITKFAGVLYMALSLLNIQTNFVITKQNKLLVVSSLLLWFWMTFVSLVSTGLIGGDISPFFALLQLIILFWLVFNDVNYNPVVQRYIFLSFIAGVVLVSILLSLGIGVESAQGDLVNEIDSTRIYFMGMNPNRMGDLAAIAILLVFSIVFSVQNKSKKNYLLLFLIPSLLSVIGFSGSRGSFLLVFLGLSVFFLIRKGKAVYKIIFMVLGIIISLIIFKFMSEFTLLQERLASSIEEGETGGRLQIWSDVIDVVMENPIFGSGVPGYGAKMSQIYGVPKDSHNLFLFVWAVGGTIGLILLLLFYYKVFKNCLINLKKNYDATNIMMFVAILFLVSKSGGAIEIKIFWLLLACITPVLSFQKSKKYKN